MSLPPNLVRHLGQIMLQWSPLWLATTAVTTALGFGYVTFFKEDVWVASQAMIVRDEIGGTLNRQGRFDNKEALKAALDTILEIARNPQVVQQALLTQLPSGSPPLSEKEINNFIGGQLAVRSPKGSEFGTTEIFYVDVRHNDPQKAIELNKAMCNSLEKRLQEIRMTRYDGIERELQYALDIAKEQRTIATEQLKKIENSVGDNLADLRSLTDSPSAGGTAKMLLDQLAGERRQVEVTTRQLQEDLRFLQSLENDPSRVLVAPSSVLNSQPGLKRLCEGLVDSQIQELQLSGRYTDVHPAFRAAQTSRQAIRQQLGTEFKLARIALEMEIKLSEQRIKSLEDQVKQAQNRISDLAGIRADYANILGEVRNRSTIIEQIEKDLAVAEANRRAAGQSSLVTRIDAPVLSDKPMGPGTKTILLAAVMAGFLSGIGLVLLLAPIDLGIKHGRRWSDHIYAANQSANRSSDSPAAYSTPTPLAPISNPPVPMAPIFATAATTTTAASNVLTNVLETTLEHAQAIVQKTESITAAAPKAVIPKIKPRSTKRGTNTTANTTANATADTSTDTKGNASSLTKPETVSSALPPETRPSSLASEIIAPVVSSPPASTENSSAVGGGDNEQQARDSNQPSDESTNSSERRTKPRRAPAAIFITPTDGNNFGFTDPPKFAT